MVNPFAGLYDKVQTSLKLFLQPYCPIFLLPSNLNLALFLMLLPSGELDLAGRCLWTRTYKLPPAEFFTSTGHPPKHTLPVPLNWELLEDRDGTSSYKC